MTKVCKRCGAVKPLADFYRQANRPDGLRGVCKPCQYTPRPGKRHAPESAGFSALYHACKNSAKARGLEFALTPEEHRDIIGRPCHHCGAAPAPFNPYQFKRRKAEYITEGRYEKAWILKNGVDRLRNADGYVPGNCVPACMQCNYARQDYTVEEFVAHCLRVARFSGGVGGAA